MLRKDQMKKVTTSQAQANLQYWLIVRTAFEEQAARIFQKHARKKNHFKPKKSYDETLNGKLSFPFLDEPVDESLANDIGQKISNGQWLRLPFEKADEFILSLYQALRLKKINPDEFGTAMFLYSALDEFKNEKGVVDVHQFKIGEGPWKLAEGRYVTLCHEEVIKKASIKLSAKDQQYFVVVLPRKSLLIYLLLGLRTFNASTDLTSAKKFFTILSSFISTSRSPMKSYFIKSLKCYTPESHLKPLLMDFLLEESDEHRGLLTKIRLGEIEPSELIYVLGLKLDEALPSIDFLQASPTEEIKLCLIIPSLAFFKLRNLILHGAEDVTQPYLVAGKSPTRLLRKLDENPKLFQQTTATRAVELYHPNLKLTEVLHGIKTVKLYGLILHDLVHCVRNSANMFKPFLRFQRRLFERETGMDMLFAIWRMTDMDYQIPSIIRTFLKEKEYHLLSRALDELFCQIFGMLNQNPADPMYRKKNKLTSKHDIHLIWYIDVLKNYSQWNELLHQVVLGPYHANHKFDSILQIHVGEHNFLKELVLQPKHANKNYLYFILRLRLRDVPDSEKLCDELNALGLLHVLKWTSDGHVKLNPKVSELKTSIEECHPQKLANELRKVIDESYYAVSKIGGALVLTKPNQINQEEGKQAYLINKFRLRQIANKGTSQSTFAFLRLSEKTGAAVEALQQAAHKRN